MGSVTLLWLLSSPKVLIRDPALLRQEAVAVLKNVANCTTSQHSGSGVTAQLMGLLFDADAQMPNMAFDDFLKCFSKPGIMEAGKALNLLPRNTGKEMRTAIMAHVGPEGRWVPEQAGFEPAIEAWKAKLARMAWRLEAHKSPAGDDEEDGEFEHLLPTEEGRTESELYDLNEAERIALETPDAGETPESGGAENDTADLKAALLEQASEVLSPDDTDPEARAAIKAHLDSILRWYGSPPDGGRFKTKTQKHRRKARLPERGRAFKRWGFAPGAARRV